MTESLNVGRKEAVTRPVGNSFFDVGQWRDPEALGSENSGY